MCSDNRASATAEKPKPLLFVAFKLLPSHARASPRVTLAVFSLPFPFYNVNNSYNFFSLFNNKQLTRRRRNFSALGFIHLFSEENPLLSPKVRFLQILFSTLPKIITTLFLFLYLFIFFTLFSSIFSPLFSPQIRSSFYSYTLFFLPSLLSCHAL